MTELERLAWQDYDAAQIAYDADKSEANRLAYLAAVNAIQAAVTRAIEIGADT